MNKIPSLRQQLLSNKHTKSYGPFLLSKSTSIAELLSYIGYNHIVVDMEHSPLDISSTVSILHAIESTNHHHNKNKNDNAIITTPIIRVPSYDDIANTKRVLDILKPPCGIMFPMIENAIQAQKAISSTIYPPNGIRGCAHPFVRASNYGNNNHYFHHTCNEDILKIVQVESREGIMNIPEIGMVDGVDCIFLGPFDISCSIGKMGQFEEGGEVMELIRYAEQLVRETSKKKYETNNNNDSNNNNDNGHGLILGGFRSVGRSLTEMFSDDVGYQLVSGSVDLGMIQNAAKMDFIDAKKAMKRRNT